MVATSEVLKRTLKGKVLSDNSVKIYYRAFAYFEKAFPEFPTQSIDIDEWVVEMNKSGKLNDVTILKYWILVKAAGHYYQTKVGGKDENGRYKFVNPFDDATRPEVKERKRNYHKPEQLFLIAKACGTTFERLLVLTTLETGARIHEIGSMKLENIHDGYFLCDVKSKTGERRYTMDIGLCNELRAFAQGRKYVFVDRKGEPYLGNRSNNLSHRIMKICRRAGLKGGHLGAHTMRHSVATMIALATRSDLAVKAKLQHDKVETSHLYMHEVEDKIADSLSPMRMLGGMFGSDVAEETPTLMLTDGENRSGAEIVKTEEGDMVVYESDMVAELYPIIPEGLAIRPRLTTKDLGLLRSIMIEFQRANPADSRIYEAQELLKRMLRKVK